jgi:uncharacterized protein YjlB
MEKRIFTDNIVHHRLTDDGTFPNNDQLPLVIYQEAVNLPARDPARSFENLFDSHHWAAVWRDGIFGYHHYHSTAHEVLGIYGGTARVQVGGPKGPELTVNPGDVIVIPAGVAHKNLGSSRDFAVVGAYPSGQQWDMNYGNADERPQADRNIAKVPLPVLDPVLGEAGPLIRLWHKFEG